MRCLPLLAIAIGLAACGGSAGSRHALRTTPARYYPPPGPPEDPWGPYVREASSRFGVPDPWIRAVMRQESAGREDAVSSAGAMGLMQVMPATYEELRARHGLGDDPFDPHANMLAGTAYLRDMYNRFGAPGFLAAYNAGPRRLDSYLSGGDPLPDETVRYVAAIAPRLGPGTNLTGPLAVYGAGQDAGPVRPIALETSSSGCDPDAAYDPTRRCVPTSTIAEPEPVVVSATGDWQVQLGAFHDSDTARVVAQAARASAPDLLGAARVMLPPTAPFGGAVLYRARLAGLSVTQASDACDVLVRQQVPCRVVGPAVGY